MYDISGLNVNGYMKSFAPKKRHKFWCYYFNNGSMVVIYVPRLFILSPHIAQVYVYQRRSVFLWQ